MAKTGWSVRTGALCLPTHSLGVSLARAHGMQNALQRVCCVRLHNKRGYRMSERNITATLRYRRDVARAIEAYRMALRSAWYRLGKPSTSPEFAREGAELFAGLKAQFADYGRTLERDRRIA
jgi:hypothetical protein